MITIGELDRQVILQTMTEVQDDFGAPVKTWATYRTVWAKVDEGGGSEVINTGQLQSSFSLSVTIRYDSAVNETMRVVWKGENYRITSIKEVQRRMFTELHCIKPDNE